MSIGISVFSVPVFEVQTSDPDLCQPNVANSHSWWPPGLRRPDAGTASFNLAPATDVSVLLYFSVTVRMTHVL
jgi:hypothetical protein